MQNITTKNVKSIFFSRLNEVKDTDNIIGEIFAGSYDQMLQVLGNAYLNTKQSWAIAIHMNCPSINNEYNYLTIKYQGPKGMLNAVYGNQNAVSEYTVEELRDIANAVLKYATHESFNRGNLKAFTKNATTKQLKVDDNYKIQNWLKKSADIIFEHVNNGQDFILVLVMVLIFKINEFNYELNEQKTRA